MPLPLPWFDSQPDPLLPTQLKPLLYLYDQYQTYDLIACDKVTPYLRNVVTPFHFLNSFHKGRFVALIDRFCPWDFPWCSQYSTKIYNFLNFYSATDYYRQRLIPEEDISIFHGTEQVAKLKSEYIQSDNLIITLPKTDSIERIVLTWLAQDSLDASTSALPPNTILQKRYVGLETSTVDSKTITINLGDFALCSLVISGFNNSLVDLIVSQIRNVRGYLYEDLDSIILEVDQLINQAFPHLTKVPYSVNYQVSLRVQANLNACFSEAVYPNSLTYVSTGDNFHKINYSHFVYTDRPDNYRSCCLLYANNNYWNSHENNYQDLGKTPVFYLTGSSSIDNNTNFFPQYFLLIPYQDPRFSDPNFARRYIAPLPTPPGYSSLFFNNFLPFFPGLIKSAYGHQGFVFGGVFTAEENDHFRKITLNITNNTIAFLSDYEYSISTVTFKAAEAECDIDRYRSDYNYYLNGDYGGFFSDTQSFSGTITYEYFTSDLNWIIDDKVWVVTTTYSGEVTVLPDSVSIALLDSYLYQLNSNGELIAGMPDSVRIKEIHAALNASEFAYLSQTNNNERVANLGYYIERIARVLGINVNPDGTIRSIRQKKAIERGKPIPAGWNFGQWGLNRGGQPNSGGQAGGEVEEYRDGIIYEQRSNSLRASRFNPEETEIVQGNYTLCENIPQLLDEILDDLDKGLGWQELGASAIPNADGSGKSFIYEGLGQLLTEMAYVNSRISQHTAQSQVAILIVQALALELLKATGQPLTAKTFDVNLGGNDLASVPFPGLASDAPSQLEQIGWVLQTLAPLLGSAVRIREDAVSEEPQTNS